jgi:hypothetical protein
MNANSKIKVNQKSVTIYIERQCAIHIMTQDNNS